MTERRMKGSIAFTHVSWLRNDIPEELNGFWQEAYPAISSISQNVAIIEDGGFRLGSRFILAERDWWDQYYDPIVEKLPSLKSKYAADAEGAELIQMEETEIDMYRRYSDYYGYVFYIAEKEA